MAQQLSNQRIAWFNGKFMPEGQVMIPFRDRSWKYGDGAFDMTRTFEGKPFRLKEHIDRFYRSLRYLQIDPGIVAQGDDGAQRGGRGAQRASAAAPSATGGSASASAAASTRWATRAGTHTGPNVVIEVLPLPLKAARASVPRRRRGASPRRRAASRRRCSRRAPRRTTIST